MASKKPIPLKDEPIYPTDEILQHIEQLTATVSNLSKEQQTFIKDIEALLHTKEDSVSSEVQEIINNLLGKYLLDVKKVETEHNDTICVLKEHYNTSAQQYSLVVKAFSFITNRCKNLTNDFSNVTKSLDALAQETSELNQKLERLGIYTACKERPRLTKSFKGLLRFVLLDMPWYWSKCLWNSRYFRNWLRICIATSIGVLLGLLAFIAHDNAVLRENHEKYIFLQKSPHLNNDEPRTVTDTNQLYPDKFVYRIPPVDELAIQQHSQLLKINIKEEYLIDFLSIYSSS